MIWPRCVKNYGGPNHSLHTPTASHTRHNNSSAITVVAVKNGEHYGEIEPQELHRDFVLDCRDGRRYLNREINIAFNLARGCEMRTRVCTAPRLVRSARRPRRDQCELVRASSFWLDVGTWHGGGGSKEDGGDDGRGFNPPVAGDAEAVRVPVPPCARYVKTRVFVGLTRRDIPVADRLTDTAEGPVDHSFEVTVPM